MSDNSFGAVIRRELDNAITTSLPVIVDYDRFHPSALSQLNHALRGLGQRIVGNTSRMMRKRRERAVETLAGHESTLAEAYELFADDRSRATFVKALLFRLIGARHVALIDDAEGYWKERQSIERRYAQRFDVSEASGWKLNRYHVPGLSTTIAVECRPIDIHATFIRQQYAYRHDEVLITAHEGDVVIDGGACWGDTTLYFTDRVGLTGGVFAIEFVPANLSILRRNIAYNPLLQARARVVEHALWDQSGEQIHYQSKGPSSNTRGGSATAVTVSIDDLIERTGVLPTFIKLDIEGAEAKALQGAQRLIAERAPRLAVAAYHSIEDLAGLPILANRLNPKYKLYLDHFTTYGEETVLFATV